MKALLTVVLLLSLKVGAENALQPYAQAPCYDCPFYNFMQRDQGFHDRQVITSPLIIYKSFFAKERTMYPHMQRKRAFTGSEQDLWVNSEFRFILASECALQGF